MVKMTVDDIEDLGTLLHIKIPNRSRSFTIVEENFINIYRKYAALRPEGMNDKRFFLTYRNGKCIRSMMGIHSIGSAPREVASYLKLPNWKEYTGHCLRRTSATLLVDGGGAATFRRRAWNSGNMAGGHSGNYIRGESAMEILSANANLEISSRSRIDAELEESAFQQ